MLEEILKFMTPYMIDCGHIRHSMTKGCKQGTKSQQYYCKKGLHVFFPKKNFFIGMNFGTIFFATCYNKCL
jgi:hypothetical protein